MEPSASTAPSAPIRFRPTPTGTNTWKWLDWGHRPQWTSTKSRCTAGYALGSTATTSPSISSSADAVERLRFPSRPRGEGGAPWSCSASLQDLLRRRQHLHARQLDARFQGELLQVHQRDTSLPGGGVRRRAGSATSPRSTALASASARATSWPWPARRSCWQTHGGSAVSFPETPLLAVLPGAPAGSPASRSTASARRPRPGRRVLHPRRRGRAAARARSRLEPGRRTCPGASFDQVVIEERQGPIPTPRPTRRPRRGSSPRWRSAALGRRGARGRGLPLARSRWP